MDRHAETQRLLEALRTFERGKIVTAAETVALIRDGNTVATAGFARPERIVGLREVVYDGASGPTSRT